MIRSGFRPSKTGPRPPFSPPIRRSSSISTPSKYSVHWLVGADVGHRDLVAGEARRVDVHDRERRQAERAVREARARDDEHRVRLLDARDVGLLAVEDEPVALALSAVEMLCEFVPASGSVIANAILVVPAPIPRSQRSFCSAVPWRARMLPTIAGETTISSSEQPPRRSPRRRPTAPPCRARRRRTPRGC